MQKHRAHATLLTDALHAMKRAMIYVFVFSFAVNILSLLQPLYSMQVYDRVFTTRSVDTLIGLTAVVIIGYAFYGALYAVRAGVVARIVEWMERTIAPQLLRISIEQAAQTGAPLAGEMSGHVFFNDRWYGFDDGLYTGARLLEILSRSANPSAVLEALPDASATPELHIHTAEGENFKLIEALQRNAKFEGSDEVITIDGVRVEYPDGFGLARASNTTPVVVTRFEADNPQALARIQAAFKAAISAVAPEAKVPF
jgi:hypothetical protein